MLRDLSVLNSNGSGILGTHLVGVLASDMPTGFPKPGLLNNDVAVGDPAGCLYRVEILTWPSTGPFDVDEYGGFIFPVAPDGTYTGTENVYKNGVPTAGSYSFTVGSGNPGDTLAPTITAVAVANATPTVVTLTASEALNSVTIPAASAFTVMGHTVQSVAVSGSTINLTVTPAFVYGEATRTVSYVQPTTNGERDVAGNLLASFNGQAITNNVASSVATVTSVTVSPDTVTVSGQQTQQFSVTVNGTNSPAQTVTWAAPGATINASGLFTAPAATSSTQAITVTATSTVDGTKKGTAIVTVPAAVVIPPVSTVTGVTITPTTKRLLGGWAQQFSSTVLGTNNPSQAVTWESDGGSIVAGLFTAPAATDMEQTITVTVCSVQDDTKTATATVIVESVAGSGDGPPVVNVVVLASDQQGNPMVGARITAILDKVDIDDINGYITPEEISGEAGEDGTLTLRLWPNALGTMGSSYIFTIENPDTGDVIAIQAVIPGEDCYLHRIGTLL